MKFTRIFAVMLLLAMAAGAAQAEELTRLSWNSCDPWNVNQNFGAPGIYKLVLSAIGCVGDYSGHDTNMSVGPMVPIPDAWRFDDAGCQGAAGVAFSTAAFIKACVALQGTAPLPIMSYGFDSGTGRGMVRMANTFNTFAAVGTTRYTLVVISFDHTYSVVGPTTPSVDCGGAGQPENFVAETQFLHTSGQITTSASPERYATWNGGQPPVATQPSTWGRVKNLYR